MKNLQLIIIDPQHDFCNPNGSLYVDGAHEDMQRLAGFIDRMAPKITDIHVTADSHHKADISHPMWWCDADGNPPAPFTIISASDLADGVWRTRKPSCHARTLAYLQALESTGRYPHCIWPEHCLIGTEGHTIHPDVMGALHGWEESRYAITDVVTKGSNPWTEHFSAVQAEVPDPEDPSTQMNTALVDTLEQADITVWAGEALSHCLANSARDVAANFSDPQFIKNMVLLTDASSNVTNFEHYGTDFVTELVTKGMQTSTCADFLKTA